MEIIRDDKLIRQELIDHFYSNNMGWTMDEGSANVQYIANVINSHNRNEKLKSYTTLKKYILKELEITRWDNKNLVFFVDYLLNKYVYLHNLLKTYYKRPDITYTYRALAFPEVRQLAELGNVFKIKWSFDKGSNEKFRELTNGLFFVSDTRLRNKSKDSFGYHYYIKPNKKFSSALKNGIGGVVGEHGSLDLVSMGEDGSDVNAVFNASDFIGSAWGMRLNLETVLDELNNAQELVY